MVWLKKVETIKNIIQKYKDPTLKLLIHCNTPHDWELSPAEKLIDRKLKSTDTKLP